jgi:hypothetical protein
MWKYDKPGRAPKLSLKTRLTVLAIAGGLLAPMVAMSGLVEDKDAPAAPPAAAAASPSGYMLRCWQDGRLIVEEYLSALPPGIDINTAKLRAQDAENQAVYVTETKNSTCLIRARPRQRTRGLTW